LLGKRAEKKYVINRTQTKKKTKEGIIYLIPALMSTMT